MSEHSYSRMWVHMVIHTKNLQPFISASAEPSVHAHIIAQLTELGCYTHIVNGMADHIHALFILHPMKTVTEVAKQVKGNTSYWINQNNLTPERFAWEKGFASFSVSDSQVLTVFRQIRDQKNYHYKAGFHEELDELITANGMVRHAA